MSHEVTSKRIPCHKCGHVRQYEPSEIVFQTDEDDFLAGFVKCKVCDQYTEAKERKCPNDVEASTYLASVNANLDYLRFFSENFGWSIDDEDDCNNENPELEFTACINFNAVSDPSNFMVRIKYETCEYVPSGKAYPSTGHYVQEHILYIHTELRRPESFRSKEDKEKRLAHLLHHRGNKCW